MRTRNDAIRSLKRYLAAHVEGRFGPEWDIRTDSEEGVVQRPVAIIEPLKQMNAEQKTVWQVNLSLPVTIYLYPTTAGTAIPDAQQLAYEAEDCALGAFNRGGHGGRPRRIPMVDFSGVDPLEAGGIANGSMEVRSITSAVNQDPDDLSLYTVVVSCTLDWLAPGEVRQYDKTVETVKQKPLFT